jgi:hypothetical protein
LSEFYSKNGDHIPVYEKSKAIEAHKREVMELNSLKKQFESIEDLTLYPNINDKSKRIVYGKSF